MTTVAYVNLWGKRVGAVAWDETTGTGNFEYDPAFVASGWNIAPVKMEPVTNHIYTFPELAPSKAFKGLPGLLADVLPDKYGNTLINSWLARIGRAPDSMNPVEMLSYIGKRGMGALEFEPVNPKGNDKAKKIEIQELISIASDILNDRQNFSGQLSNADEKAMADILKIGTSAGGARAKALIAYNETTGEVMSGQADAPPGFEHWLIKFDGVHDSQFGATYGYGRVEMAYYLMAREAGIDMSECRLFEEHGRAHFMTRRFDRKDGEKIHVQTWCAMTHRDFANISSFSYEELFQTLRILRIPYPQAEQLFRRMVFNVTARNCDDHTKNFAFIMNKEGVWDISPAYDVCHAYRPGSPWVSRQCLSVNGKRDAITRQDLLDVARAMNIKNADQVIKEISDVVRSWPAFAAQANVDPALAGAINTTLQPL